MRCHTCWSDCPAKVLSALGGHPIAEKYEEVCGCDREFEEDGAEDDHGSRSGVKPCIFRCGYDGVDEQVPTVLITVGKSPKGEGEEEEHRARV